MSLVLRYMQLRDVDRVVEIDKLAFDMAWSARSYQHEVTESNYSHMVVLEQIPYTPAAPRGWRKWLSRLNGTNGSAAHIGGEVVGYGGLWHITDEAHISTIAVHPNYRGRGWGEILLAAMIRKAWALHASYLVLEVRVSNTAAQNLYLKYGFQTQFVKEKYYRNNNEDAYEMRLDLTPAQHTAFEQRYAALIAHHSFTDSYTR